MGSQREETTVDRSEEAQGWDLIRKAMAGPQAQAYLSADRLHREVQRLETRLTRVRARGGAYGKVGLSDDVRELLVRLEAGATLSTYVH